MATAPQNPTPFASAERRSWLNGQSIGQLIKELRDGMTSLLREEFLLARTEVSQKVGEAGKHTAFLVVGGVVAYLGAFFILVALAVLLAWGLNAAGLSIPAAVTLAAFLIGAVLAGVGYALIRSGLNKLRHDRFVPDQTVQTLQEDAAWIRSKVT